MYMMAKAPTVITWSPEYAECTDYKWHNIGCSIGSTQSDSQKVHKASLETLEDLSKIVNILKGLGKILEDPLIKVLKDLWQYF